MKRFYVGNLSYSSTEESIRKLFAQYGDLESVFLVKDKGFGFVEFKNKEDAEKALELNGTELEGRPLKVNFAKPKESDGKK